MVAELCLILYVLGAIIACGISIVYVQTKDDKGLTPSQQLIVNILAVFIISFGSWLVVGICLGQIAFGKN